jgi:hypothetical protein
MACSATDCQRCWVRALSRASEYYLVYGTCAELVETTPSRSRQCAYSYPLKGIHHVNTEGFHRWYVLKGIDKPRWACASTLSPEQVFGGF